MDTSKLLLKGEPEILRAHISVEGNKIIIDRAEFPLSQYPSISNLQLLENVAAMARRDREEGKETWLER